MTFNLVVVNSTVIVGHGKHQTWDELSQKLIIILIHTIMYYIRIFIRCVQTYRRN